MTPPIRGGVDFMTPPIRGGVDSMTPPIRGGPDSMTPPHLSVAPPLVIINERPLMGVILVIMLS